MKCFSFRFGAFRPNLLIRRVNDEVSVNPSDVLLCLCGEGLAFVSGEVLFWVLKRHIEECIVASWEPMPRKRVSADSIGRFLCAAEISTMRDLCAIYARPPF